MTKAVPHILYIEDNEFNQRLIKRVLEPAGFRLSAAMDGLSGIQKAGELKPELILMDLDLPYIDGLGATAKIKSLPELAEVPIVALTSKNSRRDRERALVAGCSGFIQKPIDAATLPDQIRKYLEGERENLPTGHQTRILRDFNVNLVDQLQGKIQELEAANTELRRNEEELQFAYEQSQKWNSELQRLNRLKENIVGITSHELRTPLSIATGYVDILLEGLLGELNQEQVHVMGIAKQNLGKMEELVDKITDLTRLAMRKFPMNLETCDLNEVFLQVYEDISVFLQIRKLECHQNLSEDPMNVTADPSLLTQVFSYLLKNAICFTADHGEIFVETFQEDSWVYFKIRDTGIGLKEDDLERIFDEFYQVTDFENHKTGQFEYLTRGIGVGLSLCKGILTELGGKIWATSPGPNSGSTFIFYLPAVPKE